MRLSSHPSPPCIKGWNAYKNNTERHDGTKAVILSVAVPSRMRQYGILAASVRNFCRVTTEIQARSNGDIGHRAHIVFFFISLLGSTHSIVVGVRKDGKARSTSPTRFFNGHRGVALRFHLFFVVLRSVSKEGKREKEKVERGKGERSMSSAPICVICGNQFEIWNLKSTILIL